MRHVVRLAALGCIGLSAPANAVIVGAAPDSPAAHVDPNLTTSPYGGVVGINVAGIGPASGVLLKTSDPTHSYVLTAAHIVDPNRSGTVAPAANVTVHVNHSGNNSTVLGVSAIHVNPAWYQGPTRFNDDLVVLQLNGVVPAGVPTYDLYRVLTTAVSPVQTITIVGYGESGDGVNGKTIDNGVNVKRTGQNRADAVGLDDDGGVHYEVYQFDFDGPSGNGPQGGPTLGNAIEVGFGIGDSGGPAFITGPGGQLLVYGINTAAGNSPQGNFPLFGSVGGGQLVAAYQSFIDQHAVPEPGSLALVGLTAIGLLARRRRSNVRRFV